ncbi:MAG: (Fe-S)-binding protein [Deltaproteobacteria bacterium]|nr:(Fe-S)-binding protein [Deltaproteobacteria bacterium]MCF8120024.1 (Fe-S)-binding protein [Deltaproteobacteria bacterium]
MTAVAELVDRTQTYYCLDCGVCTGSCPVAKVFPDFSPRQIIERSLYDLEAPSDPTLWSCLTCAQCSVRCPANIDFPEFVRLMRDEAHHAGFNGIPAHNGMLQTIMAMQGQGIRQNRTSWVEAGTTAEKGEVFYFVGCRPYFDVVFRDIDAGAIGHAQNVVKILNRCRVTPVVSNDERCCGHDALWNGDEAQFRQLAQLNLETIAASGAKRVVFSCPEGYYTFKHLYPKFFGELDFEPVHILELLQEKLQDGTVALEKDPGLATYHDPCRLGRLTGVYDAPRAVIEALGLRLVEMPRSRENGVCCGTTGWMNCSNCSKQIQMERLEEAEQTGADMLVTACPKCQIHFRCTKAAFDLKVNIEDLFDLVAARIK